MALDGHFLMILDHLLGRKTIVDIRATETEQEFDNRPVRTSNVHFVLEPSQTTDIVMDAFTCSAFNPPWEKVRVSKGTVQWFGWIFDLEAQESPSLRPFETKDCDPAITGIHPDIVTNSRWAILCIFKDLNDKPYLDWEYGIPGDPSYPNIPHHGVPIALVSYRPGPVIGVNEADITNMRTVKATYTPMNYYSFPPVREIMDLDAYKDVPDGSTAFVIDEGVWYYYFNGRWSGQGRIKFDNTVYAKDIMEPTSRVDIPWILDSSAELDVHRDGFKMDPTNDYEVHLGPTPYILFRYMLYPHQRILMTRNPFAANAYSSGVGGFQPSAIELYVDGDVGHDAFPGSVDKPFKTLQAAFEAIPVQSKDEFVVYAKHLKYADVIVSNEYGQRTWGILQGRVAKSIKILLEPNCEWASDIDYAYVCTNTTFITFGMDMPAYRIRLNHCVSYFYMSNFLNRVVLAGGSSVLRLTTAEDTSALYVMGACIATIEDCYIYHLYGSAAGYTACINSRLYAIEGDSAATIAANYCDLIGAVNISDAYFTISGCRISDACAGNFYGAHILASGLDMTASPIAYRIPFFKLDNGSTLNLSTSDISYVSGHGIVVYGNSSAALRGVTIKNCQSDGVLVEGSSHLFVQNSEISNCIGDGIDIRKGSSGHIEYSAGSGNSGYGILATKYSSMTLGTAVTLMGFSGTYLEVIEGSNLVSAVWQDLHPAPLTDKLLAGAGLLKSIIPTGVPDEFQLELKVNVGALLDPNSEMGGALSNMAPSANVEEFTDPAGLAPGVTFTQDVLHVGQGYISSVLQRTSVSTAEPKTISTRIENEKIFLQQDRTVGTEFTPTGVRLRNRPGLGYSTNYPYYFTSLWTSWSTLQAYIVTTLTKLTITAIMPTKTEIRVGISPNGGASWFEYVGGTWVNLPGASTAAQLAVAPLYTAVNSLNSTAWGALMALNPRYIDVGFALLTSDSSSTPEVIEYKWDVSYSGYYEDITHMFKRTYYPGSTVFENITASTIGPPLIFTTLPLSTMQ